VAFLFKKQKLTWLLPSWSWHLASSFLKLIMPAVVTAPGALRWPEPGSVEIVNIMPCKTSAVFTAEHIWIRKK